MQPNNQYDLIIHNNTFWPNRAIKPTLQGFYLYSNTYLRNLVWSPNLWVYCNVYWGGRREERFHWENFCNIFQCHVALWPNWMWVPFHLQAYLQWKGVYGFGHLFQGLHFFCSWSHVDINGNQYCERMKKKKKTLQSYFWCMLHPILQFENILHFFSLEIM